MLPPIFVVMGVSGSGKTTIGKLLAEKMRLPFYDGDDFHPAENVAKMQAGIPLEDADRIPWLQRLNALAKEEQRKDGAIIACSALKESYRQILSEGIAPHIKWILLEGDFDLIKSRMQTRKDHYMPVDLLASQLAALEIPSYAVKFSIDKSPEELVTQIMNAISKSELGILGLGVMGRSLACNFAEKGFSLSLYNREVPGKEEHVAKTLIANHAELQGARDFNQIPSFVASLQTPRRIILMVEAGPAIDAVLAQLKPLLSAGDVVADCGNSHFDDTQRRQEMLAKDGVHVLGVGISGGEKGARYGPSVMPGGNMEGYALMQQAFEMIAAKDTHNQPCCTYIGKGGSGHFVKMVHNGIEYAEMQLIVEAYGMLRHGYAYLPDRIADLFARWNTEKHRSYLLDTTVHVLRKREGDTWLIDLIADTARSKGTGGWALQAANTLGATSPMIAAAVHARMLSTEEDRFRAMHIYQGDRVSNALTPNEKQLRDAFYFARLINHHLGFELLRKASLQYAWNLDLPQIARIWTNGCIIRSSLMETLPEILPEPVLLHPSISAQTLSLRSALAQLIIAGAQSSQPLPCHSAALNFFNGFTLHQPTANLIQAQRDFFGAHGFERLDGETGRIYHGDW